MNVQVGETGNIVIKDLRFNESNGRQSALICQKKDESVLKSSPKEINFKKSKTVVDVKDSNSDKTSSTLPALIWHKKEESVIKSSRKEVKFRKIVTGTIDIEDLNINGSYGTLAALISHMKDDSGFKSSPKEVHFRKSGADCIDIKHSNYSELSGIISTLSCLKKNGSTFISNSIESMSVSSFVVSFSGIDSVQSLKPDLCETEDLETDNSNSGSTCLLSEEECVKILFDGEWNTDYDTSDDIIDDELEERLLSFDVPFECTKDQNSVDFRMISNETLKRKMFCGDEDKSILENEEDGVLYGSKRQCLLDNYNGDVSPAMLDETFLEINFRSVSTIFYEEDPLNEILELINRNSNGGEEEIKNDLDTLSIMASKMHAEKINHTLENEENLNQNLIFSMMTVTKEDNLYICRKSDLKECEINQNNSLGHFERLFYSREIRSSSTSSCQLASSVCRDQALQNKCMSPKYSLNESSDYEMKQVSLKEENKGDQINTFDTEYIPDISNRKYFWEYLKRRTESLCATYEKFKNEIILSSHVA